MSGFDGTEIADLLYNPSRPSANERSNGADLKDVREAYWQYVDDNLECMEWLQKFNCLPYYRKHKNRFMYDPKQNRLVFLVKQGDKFVDGAGRLLKGEGPKWYRYGSSGLGFYAEHKLDEAKRLLDPLVVVEDAASACSMSRVYSSLALLGTSITTQQLIYLNSLEYTDIIIALDKDAIVNATEVVSELGSFGYNVNVVQLRDDAKYLSVDEIKSSLKFT